MKFGIGLSVQHLPDEPQAARFQEQVLRSIRLLGEKVLPHVV